VLVRTPRGPSCTARPHNALPRHCLLALGQPPSGCSAGAPPPVAVGPWPGLHSPWSLVWCSVQPDPTGPSRVYPPPLALRPHGFVFPRFRLRRPTTCLASYRLPWGFSTSPLHAALPGQRAHTVPFPSFSGPAPPLVIFDFSWRCCSLGDSPPSPSFFCRRACITTRRELLHLFVGLPWLSAPPRFAGGLVPSLDRVPSIPPGATPSAPVRLGTPCAVAQPFPARSPDARLPLRYSRLPGRDPPRAPQHSPSYRPAPRNFRRRARRAF